MSIKDDYIRVRVTTDEKKLIKEVAKAKGMNMSEFMLNSTRRVVEKHTEKVMLRKVIEDRAIRTEMKLIKIAERIRGKKSKKSSFFNLGH